MRNRGASYLGPGLLESVYRQCLAHEFDASGIDFVIEKQISVVYKNLTLDYGFRADFIVDNELIIELKSVESILPVHHAQILTYMNLAKISKGLLINFNVATLRDGIKRFVL